MNNQQINEIELVIFDCDGVLVDSELITNSVLMAMLNELGLDVTIEELFERFVGYSMAYCLDLVAQMLGKPVPQDFVPEYRKRSAIALQQKLQPVEGITEVLNRLTVPYCVASSGDHQKMQTTLGITNLFDYFEGKIFSVTEVARGKPYPDIFLYAAKQMGVEPNKCVVVEDSPVGVQAGISAGMKVYGYAKFTPASRLAQEGVTTFTKMIDLVALIE